MALLRELSKKLGKQSISMHLVYSLSDEVSTSCVCLRVGIQMLYRDYDFTAQPVFTEDDIIALVPVVKHTDFRVRTLPW